jgi:hypothetical protein
MSISAVAVANVKLVGTGVLELYERGTAGTPGTANLVATLPAQDRDRRTAFAFFNALSRRHWQLKWTNPTSASDYAELGHAFLGVETVPTFNVRVPARISRFDPSVASMSVDGQESYARRTKFELGAWEFDFVPETQLTTLRTLFDTLGVGTPMFMVLDTALAWSCWLARLGPGEMTRELTSRAGRYTIGFPWREAR